MGLFTRIGQQARAEGAALNYMLEKNVFRAAGYKKLPGDATYAEPFANRDRLELGTADLDAGRGGVHQYLKREYGMGDETAAHIVAAGRNDVADIPRPENAKHFRGVGQQQVAPGSASTQVKIKSPTQAEQVAAGLSATKRPQKSSDIDRIKLGDKDMRSMLAEEKLRIAQEVAGGGYSRDQLVDMLNDGTPGGWAPGKAQQAGRMIQEYNNDDRMNLIIQAGNEGKFIRPEFETSNFVGEGQFGRVEELAPGYVVKKQAPLVEFGGYQEDTDLPLGNLVGLIQDHRDVKREADQMNLLNKTHISPKVENLIVNPDGSTEMIMRDLRDNYITGNDYVDQLESAYEKADSPKKKASLLKEKKIFDVKRKQQEAVAGMQGVELGDRHLGNVMAHQMNNRPLQIDPSGAKVEGFAKQQVIGQRTIEGMNAAGLVEEADIFTGLLNDAINNQDEVAFNDLVQQGASRLMKINQVPSGDVPSAAAIIDAARDPRMAGIRF